MQIQVIGIMMIAEMMPSGGSFGGLGKMIVIAEQKVDAKYRVKDMACSELSIEDLPSADASPSI